MKQDRYLFDGDRLIIQDVELGIDIDTYASSVKVERAHPGRVDQKTTRTRWAAYYKVDGQLAGQWLSYHRDGAILQECFYLHGKMHGPSRLFTPEGSCLSETWFCHDKQEGKAWRHYLSGRLCSIERYRRGGRHGRQEHYYDAEGSPQRSRLFYVDGRLDGVAQLFWDNGQCKRLVELRKGVREGWDRVWSRDGRLLDEGEYRHGAPIGVHRSFFDADPALREAASLKEKKSWTIPEGDLR